jgi:Arc/MetJ-type ribon-helix-helix transcriptional regulator
VLRAILFEHVYGRVAMRRLEVFAREREKELGIERPFFSNRPEDRNGAEPAAATPRQVNLQMLGKAANDFKLHLPQRLKDDLASLAAAHRITASHYVRKALVLTLMGERFHTAWQSALGALAAGEPVPPDVTRFEAE